MSATESSTGSLTQTTHENPLDQLLFLASSTTDNISSSSSKLETLRTALETRAITSDDILFLQQEQDISSFIQRHDLIDVQHDVKRIIRERLSFLFLPTVSQLTLPLKKTTEVTIKDKDKSSVIVPWKDEGIPKSPISYQISGLHPCQADVYYRCTILRTKEVVTTSYRFYLDSITPLQASTTSTTSISHSKKTTINTNIGGTKKTLWFAAKKMKAGGGGLLFFQLEHTKDWIEKNAIGKVSAVTVPGAGSSYLGQLNTFAPAAVAAATEHTSSTNDLRGAGGASSGSTYLSGPVAVSVRSSLTDKLIHVTAVVTTSTTTTVPPSLKTQMTESGIGIGSATRTTPGTGDKRSVILPSTSGNTNASSSNAGTSITDAIDSENEASALLAALAKLIPPTPTTTGTSSLHSPPTGGGSTTSSSSFSSNSGMGMGIGMGIGIGTPSIFKNKYNSLTSPSGSVLPMPSALSPTNQSTSPTPPTRTPPPLSNTFLGLQSVKPLSSQLPHRTSGVPGAYNKSGSDPHTPLVHAVSFGPDSRVSMASRKNLVLEKAHSQVGGWAANEWVSETTRLPPIYQMGKVNEEEFAVDFHTISPFQAFVISLSVFDH